MSPIKATPSSRPTSRATTPAGSSGSSGGKRSPSPGRKSPASGRASPAVARKSPAAARGRPAGGAKKPVIQVYESGEVGGGQVFETPHGLTSRSLFGLRSDNEKARIKALEKELAQLREMNKRVAAAKSPSTSRSPSPAGRNKSAATSPSNALSPPTSPVMKKRAAPASSASASASPKPKCVFFFSHTKDSWVFCGWPWLIGPFQSCRAKKAPPRKSPTPAPSDTSDVEDDEKMCIFCGVHDDVRWGEGV